MDSASSPRWPTDTWIAYAKDTGAPVTVDDRTFNEADHVRAWPPPSEKPTKTAKKGKQA